MFRKLDVPILGVVENMAWYELPDGTRTHPFGEGGGVTLADDDGVELLGQIPLDEQIRVGGDEGAPVVLAGGPMSERFQELVAGVMRKLDA